MKKAFLWIRFSALIASLCMVIVAISFSWFSQDNNASVDRFDPDVVDEIRLGLEIAPDKENLTEDDWKYSAINIPDTNDIYFKPIVGDGESFFERKVETKPLSNSNFSASVIKDGEYQELSENGKTDYLVYEYQMRLNKDESQNNKLVLGKNSYIKPASIDDDGNVADKADFAAGAMRVYISIKNSDGEDVAKIYWVPNTKYQVNSNGTAKTNGTVEEKYVFRNGTEKGEIVELVPEGYAGCKQEGNTFYFWGDLAEIDRMYDLETIELADLAGTRENPLQCRMTIWLDGEDRECTNAVVGGNIAVSVNFRTVIKES